MVWFQSGDDWFSSDDEITEPWNIVWTLFLIPVLLVVVAFLLFVSFASWMR